ncbi:MAG: hypothetical protein NWF04_05000 [Candidatus Bathyarchaeota archaeon]|nr:hypothetical protein [Candidatus Bathyarchaeota archaeon]
MTIAGSGIGTGKKFAPANPANPTVTIKHAKTQQATRKGKLFISYISTKLTSTNFR